MSSILPVPPLDSIYYMKTLQIIKAGTTRSMDDEQQAQETEQILNKKMERLKMYFDYYREKSSSKQFLCIASTNQFLRKQAAIPELQVTDKTVDDFIVILEDQLSLLGLYQQHETTISQYRWLEKWKEELERKQQLLNSEEPQPKVKKQQIKLSKYAKRNQISIDYSVRISQKEPRKKKITMLNNLCWKRPIQEVSKKEQETDQGSIEQNQYQ